MLARKKRENKLDDPNSTTITSDTAPKFKIIKKETKKTKIQAALQPLTSSQSTTTQINLENSLGTKKDTKQQISIIRSKRSQADDEWPISYKGDSAKRGFATRRSVVENIKNSTTQTNTTITTTQVKDNEQPKKRDKRLILDEVETKFEDNNKKISNNNNNNYSSLFHGLNIINNKMLNKRDNEYEQNSSNKEKRGEVNPIQHQQTITMNINGQGEEILHRSKRVGES